MNLISRRHFLSLLGAGAGSLAFSQMLKPSLLLAQTAGTGTGKNFIVINLFGGVDGMSMCPYREGPAADLISGQLRRTLGIPRESILPFLPQTGVSNKIGLHPSLARLAATAGANMKIIQKYGIIHDPGRSHDTCQILFSLGRESIQGGDAQGVLARLMDQQLWESFQYWAIGSPPIPDVNTRNAPPIVLSELNSFNYGQHGAEGERDVDFAAQIQRSLLEVQVPRNQVADKYKGALQTMHRVVSVLRRDIAAQVVGNNPSGNYSEQGIGPSFRDAAKILKTKATSTEFGQRDKDTIIYLGQGGYDTHSNQNTEDSLPRLLSGLGNNLAVLVDDLKAMGTWNNTVILVFSEFGRTNFENGSLGDSSVGTDHGWGNTTFAVGGALQAGILGEAPTSNELRDTDVNALIPTIDFRRIWGDILQWLNVAPSSILDEEGFTYTPLGLLQ